jgi:hypothetical protein
MPRNSFWWTCYIIIALNALYYVTGAFLLFFACIPHRKIWEFTVPGKCLPPSINNTSIVSSSLNLASDLAILFLPQRVIWRLQLSTNKKIGVAALFAIGVL